MQHYAVIMCNLSELVTYLSVLFIPTFKLSTLMEWPTNHRVLTWHHWFFVLSTASLCGTYCLGDIWQFTSFKTSQEVWNLSEVWHQRSQIDGKCLVVVTVGNELLMVYLVSNRKNRKRRKASVFTMSSICPHHVFCSWLEIEPATVMLK